LKQPCREEEEKWTRGWRVLNRRRSLVEDLGEGPHEEEVLTDRRCGARKSRSVPEKTQNFRLRRGHLRWERSDAVPDVLASGAGRQEEHPAHADTNFQVLSSRLRHALRGPAGSNPYLAVRWRARWCFIQCRTSAPAKTGGIQFGGTRSRNTWNTAQWIIAASHAAPPQRSNPASTILIWRVRLYWVTRRIRPPFPRPRLHTQRPGPGAAAG
jgi:hypothetical protein